MNGVLNIDKPAGMTSHDVVARVRRLAKTKRVGHAGTLDPDATGVLLVCVGPATRIADFLADDQKAYSALLVLGVTTTTEDASGEVLLETDASTVTEADLCALIPRFIGDIQQIPPMVSAVHHEGQRLYALARQGITVERAPRPVRIDRIRVTSFVPGPRAAAELEVECGKGTYIRTLCADLGAALGSGGHMGSLRRTRVGAFRVSDARPLDTINEMNIGDLVFSASFALSRLPSQTVTDETQASDIRHGRSLPTDLPDAATVRVVDSTDMLLALAKAHSGTLQPFKVFA